MLRKGESGASGRSKAGKMGGCKSGRSSVKVNGRLMESERWKVDGHDVKRYIRIVIFFSLNDFWGYLYSYLCCLFLYFLFSFLCIFLLFHFGQLFPFCLSLFRILIWPFFIPTSSEFVYILLFNFSATLYGILYWSLLSVLYRTA